MSWVEFRYSGMKPNSAGGSDREHEDAMIKMGALPPREELKIPDGMDYVFEIYHEMRFSIPHNNKIHAREELTYSTLNEYQKAMQFMLSPTECSIMLSMDAIFNSSQ